MSSGDFQDVINSWISSVTRPAIGTYAAEVPRASQSRLIMSVGIVTVIAAIAGLIGGVFTGHAVGGFISALIITPVGFLIVAGALYLGARLMKGTGTFEQHAWVVSTIWAPITILSSIAGIIPILGGLIGILLGLYSIYLYYLSQQAVHRLDSSNAIISMLIGIVVYIIGVAIIGLIIAAILLPFGLIAANTGMFGR